MIAIADRGAVGSVETETGEDPVKPGSAMRVFLEEGGGAL